MLCFNFFFLPPIGALTIADPHNWIALFAFLAVSLVASNLSAVARERTREALWRRDELARLFDLSRDVQVITDSREAITMLARSIARRFDLEFVAIALPRAGDWDVHEAGAATIALDRRELSKAFAAAQTTLEFDAYARTYAGHRTMEVDGHTIRLVPLRVGTKPIGLLAAAGRPIEPGTLDTLGGVVAIAIERAHFLEERKAAELTRQSEELKTALLASLGHDLRTPLTAIRVAASNIKASWMTADARVEQTDLILAEVERLTRLFQNILDMARIDAGAIAAESRWAHPSEIIAAARGQVEQTLQRHKLDVSVDPDVPVRLDPRLTATALAHLLENAAQYSPAGSAISVNARVTGDGPDCPGPRPWSRHRPGRPAAPVRSVLSRRRRDDASLGHGHGTRDCARTAGRGARPHLGGELSRRRRPVHHPGARDDQGIRAPSLADRMTQASRILLVDDEVAIQRAVEPLLRSRGYQVDVAGTGTQALKMFAERSPDLIVLDLGLPDIEGTEVCRRVRATSRVPIVVLSARGAEADKVNALDLGADDYVTKPFGPEELLARIRVALRRVMSEDEAETGVFRAGDLTIDYDRRRVLRHETEIRLTPKEFELLSLLARNHDRVLTHRTILKAIWGPNAVEQTEHLWTLVAQVRKKIEPDPGTPQYLLSEPWVGYRFATADSGA